MNKTTTTVPRDHCWGAGRIDPDRLRRVLLVHRGRSGAGLLGLIETLLLLVLFVSVLRDASPVQTLQVIADWTLTILRLLATLLTSLI